MIDPKGRVVYTVFKETDFATSLKSGPWSATGLARAFEASRNLKQGETHIEDFANYAPSYEAPASFAATPIFQEGQYIGSLIIQLPLDKISEVANDRGGLGQKGQTIVLGSDFKLRADAFRMKEKYSVVNSFNPDSKLELSMESVQLLKQGKDGFVKSTSYDGLDMVSYMLPFKIENLTWYMIVELSSEEVYSGLNSIARYSLAMIVIGILVIGLVSAMFGENIAKSLREIAASLLGNSEHLKNTSETIANASRKLAEATTEQASSLEETSASLEEISSMIGKSAESADITSSTSAESYKKAEEGKQAVDQMLASMDEINQSNEAVLNQINESNRQMIEIASVIQEIGTRTKVINEIVFQTKLLSFNASVEAARAGEHGKGFAVVAEEVGNLAQMSGNAAKEITDMLESSTAKVESIVKESQEKIDNLVEVGKAKLQSGISIAQECSIVLNEIVSNASKVSNLAEEISQASKEQSLGVVEINKAMSQLDLVTQQNAATSEATAASADDMSGQVAELKEQVSILTELIFGVRAKEVLDVDQPQEDFAELKKIN